MKKSKLFLILTLLCSIFFTIGVSAEEVKTGKIVGNYVYGDVKLTNANVAIYKIGNITTDDTYSYELLDDFNEEKVDFGTLNSEQREEKTKKFYKIITEKNIEPLSQTLTNQNGQFAFERLNAGVYLIKVDDLTTAAGVYRSLPTLIFYPDVAADGSYVYDLSVNMKTEFVKADANNNDDSNGSNNQNNGNNVNAPNTYDAIVMYIVLFVVSIVLLTVLICYICMYSKKKEKEKNEEERKRKNEKKENK